MRWIWGPWTEADYRLDRMSFRDLLKAYFTYYAIQVYLLLAAVGILLAWRWSASLGPTLAAAGLMLVLYPLVEYALHRFVLHARWMYKNPYTARLWKRIHYDHHQNPNDLKVLFGALYTTLPMLAVVTMPLGYLVGGAGGLAAAFATGCLLFAFYEFCHCVQHLPVMPRNRWLRDIKRRHLAHHFHNEQGNFGITNPIWDRIIGTFYDPPNARPKSPTAFNLGYTEEEKKRYPWVAALSADDESYARARRRSRRAAGSHGTP